jgi:hypothetical protein
MEQLNEIDKLFQSIEAHLDAFIEDFINDVGSYTQWANRVYDQDNQQVRLNKKRNELLEKLNNSCLKKQLYLQFSQETTEIDLMLHRFRLDKVFYSNEFSFIKKCYYYDLYNQFEVIHLPVDSFRRQKLIYSLSLFKFLVYDLELRMLK